MKSYTADTRKPFITSGSESLLNKIGNAVYVVDAPGRVVVTTSGGDTIELQSGRGYQFDNEYSWIRLTNLAADGLLEVIVGGGRFFDALLAGSVSIDAPAAVESLGDVVMTGAALQVAAANADRKRITLQALQANAGEIRIGDANVAANRGLQIFAGQAVTLDVTGAVYAFGPVGDSLAIVEETN